VRERVERLIEGAFANVALKIGDRRLATVLAQLAANVKTHIHNASVIPRRSDVRADVEALKAKAEALEKALSRISKGFRFLHLPLVATEIVPRARETTSNVIGFCDKALANISVKRGAPKKPGRVVCALIVIEAWAWAHGKAPHGAHSPKALEACEDFWRACGGPPIGRGDPDNWREAFKAALALPTDRGLRRSIRDEIRRGME
jgi:hypothetical protein